MPRPAIDSPTLRIATRDSPLAMWQAHHVADALRRAGYQPELVPLVSGGDVDQSPIDGTRTVGVFTKRIQRALLDDEADIAVHSLKDLPTEPDDRFRLAAIPARGDVADCLIGPAGPLELSDLRPAMRIGTGSTRRVAQLRRREPLLRCESIRGNVQTRLAKLAAGDYDAIVLARAGLKRLGMDELAAHPISTDVLLPAPGQGALGIEVLTASPRVAAAVASLDHLPTRLAVTAERAALAALHGGCLAPIAALGQCVDDQLHLRVDVLAGDGTERLSHRDSSPIDGPSAAVALGQSVAEQLRRLGADRLVASVRI